MNQPNSDTEMPAASQAKRSRTTVCPACHGILVTSNLTAGRQIRCARCGHLSRYGKTEKIATDRLAWRSFWLGLSSLVFLFLTGIPAVYYGVRSLLRMRFVRPKRSDRAAAITGTAMGGCFGIGIGSLIAVTGLVILVAVVSLQKLTDPAVITENLNKLYQVDMPDDMVATKGRIIFNSHYFLDFANGDDWGECTRAVRFTHQSTSMPINTGSAIQPLIQANIPDSAIEQTDLRQAFEWTINGKPTTIRKLVYELTSESSDEPADTNETGTDRSDPIVLNLYYGLVINARGLYGISVVVDSASSDWSEDDIRHFFDSIRF